MMRRQSYAAYQLTLDLSLATRVSVRPISSYP